MRHIRWRSDKLYKVIGQLLVCRAYSHPYLVEVLEFKLCPKYLKLLLPSTVPMTLHLREHIPGLVDRSRYLAQLYDVISYLECEGYMHHNLHTGCISVSRDVGGEWNAMLTDCRDVGWGDTWYRCEERVHSDITSHSSPVNAGVISSRHRALHPSHSAAAWSLGIVTVEILSGACFYSLASVGENGEVTPGAVNYRVQYPEVASAIHRVHCTKGTAIVQCCGRKNRDAIVATFTMPPSYWFQLIPVECVGWYNVLCKTLGPPRERANHFSKLLALEPLSHLLEKRCVGRSRELQCENDAEQRHLDHKFKIETDATLELLLQKAPFYAQLQKERRMLTRYYFGTYYRGVFLTPHCRGNGARNAHIVMRSRCIPYALGCYRLSCAITGIDLDEESVEMILQECGESCTSNQVQKDVKLSHIYLGKLVEVMGGNFLPQYRPAI